MSSNNETPMAACEYCGRANPDRLPACAECGNPLAADPPPENDPLEGKSKAVAVLLTLLLGPLGLCYVRAYMSSAILILIGIPLRLTHFNGLWLTIGSRLVCSIGAYYMLTEQEKSSDPANIAARLLDQAARLENTDREQAIAAYEEIIRTYPGTPASRESERNIQTLKKHA